MTNHPGPTLRVLNLQPHSEGSHESVSNLITTSSHLEWGEISIFARSWKWSMRLSAAFLADGLQQYFDEAGPFDAVFTTSMLNLADLRALWDRAGLPHVPFVLYMHENQIAYPEGVATSVSRERDVHFALTNLVSMLAADLTIFNSGWNRSSFMEGIDELLQHSRHPMARHIRPRLQEFSIVIWPPVARPPLAKRIMERPYPDTGMPIRVVWPHRWEHDKGPEELLEIARAHSETHNLRWTILGQSFSQIPEAMRIFQEEFRDRIDHMGFVEDKLEYWKHLARCDWVLSTAKHEFFGIAVAEAMLAGCLPWLPDRLSYREILPDIAKGLSPMKPPDDPDAVRAAIREHLAPAVADEAVRRIDAAIESVAKRD